MDRRVSVEPFAPGEYLQDFLEGKGWTQDDLASVLKRTRQHVNRLLQGKTAITPETAHELAQAFGTSAELWMNLQVSYELSLTAKDNREIERRAALFERWPVREIIQRGWMPNVNDTTELERALCAFLDITSPNENIALAVAARKSTSYESDTPAHQAWYRRCWQLAENAPASRYNDNKIEEAIGELRTLAAYPEDTRRVPKMLSDFGIRFVINKHLHGTKIDAVAFWLDKSSPVIAISLRHGRIDNFWFNLMHELVHIKYRDQSAVDIAMDASECDDDLPDIEKRANAEAAQILIPSKRLESFVQRVKPYFYQRRIVQFAQLHGVHPGIVVGQLHHRPNGLDPQQLRKLLVNIRQYVIGQAVTDGWGNMPSI